MNHVTDDLVRLHDGVLDDERAREVREHLAQCVECRDAGEAIAFSRRMLTSLSPVELRDEDRASARAAMLHAAPRRFRRDWMVAAAAIAIFVVTWLLQPRADFVAPPKQQRSIERLAIAAQRARVFFNPTVSARELRNATMVVEIDHHRIALTSADAASLADAPPSRFREKRIEVRHVGDLRVFTWTASGHAYSLVVPRGMAVADACAMCHGGSRTLAYIRRATQRL